MVEGVGGRFFEGRSRRFRSHDPSPLRRGAGPLFMSQVSSPADLSCSGRVAQPILQSSQSFLQQKICLMALIDAVSRRNVTERTIPFSVVAFETKISEDEVEHLVMKALSCALPFAHPTFSRG